MEMLIVVGTVVALGYLGFSSAKLPKRVRAIFFSKADVLADKIGSPINDYEDGIRQGKESNMKAKVVLARHIADNRVHGERLKGLDKELGKWKLRLSKSDVEDVETCQSEVDNRQSYYDTVVGVIKSGTDVIEKAKERINAESKKIVEAELRLGELRTKQATVQLRKEAVASIDVGAAPDFKGRFDKIEEDLRKELYQVEAMEELNHTSTKSEDYFVSKYGV